MKSIVKTKEENIVKTKEDYLDLLLEPKNIKSFGEEDIIGECAYCGRKVRKRHTEIELNRIVHTAKHIDDHFNIHKCMGFVLKENPMVMPMVWNHELDNEKIRFKHQKGQKTKAEGGQQNGIN